MLSCCNTMNLAEKQEQFYIRRFMRVGIPFVVWSLIYFFFNITFRGENYDIKSFIQNFLVGHFNPNMWFFIPLFGLYLSMPYLRILYHGMSDRERSLFFLFSFLACAVYPYFAVICTLKMLSSYEWFPLGCHYIFIALMGYWLGHNDICLKYRRWIYVAATLLAVGVYGLHLYKTIRMGQWFYQGMVYDFMPSVVIPIAVFIWFKYTSWSKFLSFIHVSPSVIARISGCSFGVYLLHGAVLCVSERYALAFSNQYYGFILTYIFCLITILVLKNMPYINKIVP